MQGKKVRKEKRKTKSRKQGTKTCKQENRTQGVSIATNLPVSCYKAETGTSRRRNMWCAVRSSAKCSLPRVHVTHPYSRVCITSAFSMRNFRANGAASISYSSRLNRLYHAHASRTRRLIPGIISALASIRPPRYI